MSDDPLLVLTAVPRAAFPIIEALRRLHRDVGSMKARLAFPQADQPLDPDLRVLCVGCADGDDVRKLSRDLSAELRDDPESAALASKVAVIEMVHGLYVVAFIGVPCARAASN